VWYKAVSVITAILHCDRLSVEKNTHTPSCPKEGNNIHCLSDFPLSMNREIRQFCILIITFPKMIGTEG